MGTGSFEPEFRVTNDDYAGIMETSDEWIKTRTGISERRFNLGKPNFQMGVEASEKAIASAGLAPSDIDCVIVSTTTPDFYYPSAACLISKALGIDGAPAFDVSAACTGFIYGLDIAQSYLETGRFKKILVVASEMLTPQIDFADRSTCVLFGDGAGAFVVESGDGGYHSYIGASGEDFENLQLYCRANYDKTFPFEKDSADPFAPYAADGREKYIQMNGREVYKFAVDVMPSAVNKVCEAAGVRPADIDLLIPHQANIRIIQTAMKNLDMPEDRVWGNIERRGNCSSSCVPTCFDEAVRAGKIKRGDKVVMVAFGGGFTYGALYIEY